MHGSTIIVTGAAGALGSALSLQAAAAGMNTVMLDCDRKALESSYDFIVAQNLPEPILYPLDLAGAGPEHFEEMMTAIQTEFGGLDALVHCAARFEGLTPLEQFSPAEWLIHMQVNLNAAWLMSSQALPLLRESDSASLIFMLEDMARMQGAFWGPYGIAKHALRAMVHQFAAENGSAGLQILGINPGPMRSPLRSRAYHSENPETQPEPDRVAHCIMQLMNRESVVQGHFVDLAGD